MFGISKHMNDEFQNLHPDRCGSFVYIVLNSGEYIFLLVFVNWGLAGMTVLQYFSLLLQVKFKFVL